MTLSEAIEKVSGLRYIIDELEIISPPARRILYNLPFMTRLQDIETAFVETKEIHSVVSSEDNRQLLSLIKMKLMQVKDIQGTIKYIKSKNVKDDIEFFELKHFALLSEAIRQHVETLKIQCIQIPNLTALIEILDPENKKIPSFHVYDAYSTKLAEKRKQYTSLKSKGDEDRAEEIRHQALEIEDSIRKELSDKVRPFSEDLSQALHHVAKLDLLIAKSHQISRFNLSCPSISNEKNSLKGLYNPQVEALLKEDNKKFQPVNIDVIQGVTLIVGANMAGKSILLKSVALVQYLAQFGFYVPCQSATLIPVEDIFVSMGDGQNEMRGLSSFGAEMLQLNDIIQYINDGKKILVLLDELARTTNPEEGKAIVSGMVELLDEKKVMTLITTHYSGLRIHCKRLRVKGFRADKVVGALNAKNINDYMDYELIEDVSEEAPHEAVRIAEILGVSDELIQRTKYFLEKK